jgi:hypothetical protein
MLHAGRHDLTTPISQRGRLKAASAKILDYACDAYQA